MKVAVLGSALVDISAKSFQPLTPNDSSPGKTTMHSGGVGRNIAETLARLNANVSLITNMGDDVFAKKMLDELQHVGVNTSYIQQLSGPSSTYTSIFNNEGELLYGISDVKFADIVPQHISKALEEADVLVFSSNHSPEITQALIQKYRDKIIVVDPISIAKCQVYLDVLPCIHTLKCNVLEAEAFTNLKIKTLDDIPKVAQAILNLGVKRVFITLGQDGSYYSNGTQSGFVASISTEVINVSGAGDAFTSGLIFGILQNFNLEETVSFATYLAKTALESEKPVNPNLLDNVLNYII